MYKNNKTLYIILRKSDFTKINCKKVICFSLCPEIIDDKFKKISTPNPILTSKESQNQLLKSKEIIEIILDRISIKNAKLNKIHLRELIKPYLDLKISMYLYLTSCLPNSKYYKILIKDKWKTYKSKTSLIIDLENDLRREKGNTYDFLYKLRRLDYSFFHKALSKVQIFLINRLIKNRRIFLLSCNKSYFMPKIFKKLKNSDKNIISYNQSKKLITLILIIIKQFFNLIFKKRNIFIEFFMIPTLDNKKRIYINKNKEYILDYIDKEYYYFLLENLENYISAFLGYGFYSNKLFINSIDKNSQSIYHTNRFPDLNALSNNLSKLKVKQHLITHGTHTNQTSSEIGEFVSESLAVGMLTTSIPNMKIYSQSIFSDDYLLNKKIPYKEIYPLNFKKKENLESSVFNILCAGTVKQLGARRYYFESSFEYLYCIKDLCKKLYDLDFDFKITIRIRDVKNEINQNIINLISKNSNGLIQISDKKYLSDDIAKSDCLLALSSTTLEEAINSQVPSMSYGLSTYNHFANYKGIKYRIDRGVYNYNKLQAIEKILNRNFIYLKSNFLTRKNSFFDFII